MTQPPGPAPAAEGRPEEGVRISDEVVATIAGIAASEVEGVAGMSGGIVGDLTEILGKRNLAKGAKVQVGEREAAIDLFLVVDYGVRIPAVAQKVQEAVKRSVEAMTALRVVEVNVHIQGVSFDRARGPEPGPEAREVRLR